MIPLKDLSIQRKLMVIILLTTMLAVLLTSAAFLVYDFLSFRDEVVNDLDTLTATIQVNITEAVVFNNREGAGKIVSGLEVQPHIVAAWVFDRDGAIFSEYRRDDSIGEAAQPVDGLQGHDWTYENSLTCAQDIPFGDRVVGSLQIRTDLTELDERRSTILKILGAVILSVFGVAFLVSSFLQRIVSRPVLDLVEVVRVVSDRKDYTVRAKRGGDDELGKLIDGFNDMLGQIELRDDELQVARDRAEQANRSKSVFLANMSHELRTPLTAIIGYSEILGDDAKDLGMTDFLPDLEKIHAAGKHLLGLINSILDLSKVEAGKMELFPEKFEVATLVEEMQATVRQLMEKHHNTFEVRPEGELGSAMTDLTKVRQILLNVLSNAAKFTDQGLVRLTISRTAGEGTDWLTFQVSDTGIGMNAQQVKKLFQPFQQADASTSRNYGGTGLGLALCKRFAEMLYGSITVASKHGEGSTFTVKVPANLVAAKQTLSGETRRPITAELSAREVARAKGLSKETPLVLVVDDEVQVQGLLREILVKEGFRVELAANGAEALRLAEEIRPDIITLDVMMPDMDGWSVLTALKSNTETASIPVIMISVVDEEQKGYTLGADYLTKPIDRGRLAALLDKYRGQAAAPLCLVIDDDPHIRSVVCRLLKEQSWMVDEAEDGVAALRRVAENRPTLILLDLMMPRMDGFDFVTQLRKNTDWRQIPIVVLTAMDLGPEERRRLNGGVERILEKGAYSLDELKAEIRSLAKGMMAG